MHAADIIGYTHDGAIYCPDCGEQYDTGAWDSECAPIFADNGAECIGETCNACRMFLGPDLDWHPAEDLREYRWIRCGCGHRQPMDNTITERLACFRGRQTCPNCLGAMHA